MNPSNNPYQPPSATAGKTFSLEVWGGPDGGRKPWGNIGTFEIQPPATEERFFELLPRKLFTQIDMEARARGILIIMREVKP